MKKYIPLILPLCLVFLSCKKDLKTLQKIVINQAKINLFHNASTQSIPMESNINWTAESTKSWCTVSPSKEDASSKETAISLTENDNYKSRKCTVNQSQEDEPEFREAPEKYWNFLELSNTLSK